ncbi:type IV pilus assembly protein PilN [Deinococcus reticulitermitis]|uniref:Type IV pilus assembly protein PilN n=1 Tax=Deinococcus reticulitermitis TaxID=856736 RepID=A0A1H6X1M9_9DEIO|nr:hypothetical protein [Deinococcus reticulitermitis]SEJ22979.1 type IV pilus assembly protein PilN [Deinococcus reticulitermitis]
MVEINLLPKEYRKQTQPDVWRYASIGVAGLTTVLLAGWFVIVSGSTSRLSEQSAELQRQIDALTPAKQEGDRLQARKTELEQVTAVALQLRDQKTYWSNDLANFTGNVPRTVVIRTLSMAGTPANPASAVAFGGRPVQRQLEISGVGRSQDAVSQFIKVYESDPAFGVDFRGMQRQEETGTYAFTASIGVLGDVPEPVAQAPASAGAAPAAPAAPAEGGTP